MTAEHRNHARGARRPEWIPVKAFACAILIGTLLLMLPWSRAGGGWTAPLPALFTATSATCVTGLIVVDTGSYFSHFGQLVILCLMQIGGLGIMTMGTFFLILIGRRLRVRDEFVLMDSLGSDHVRGLRSLMWHAFIFAMLFEASAAAVLAHRLVAVHGYPTGRAVYVGLFHAVSAFCNAGFSLFADSLMGLRTDPVVVWTVIGLIVIGGLGFLVLYNLTHVRWWSRNRLRRGRLSLHTKLVLSASLFLVLFMWTAFLVLEWGNTLAPLPWTHKLNAALFQAVTPRTAGFNVVDMAAVQPATRFLTMLMMFVGGSPGSTAGGIKTTTVFVMLATVFAMIKARDETDIFGRTISTRVVREALSIFILGVFCVLVAFGILLVSEHALCLLGSQSRPEALLFETISAIGTVGLSTGITARLSFVGKLCIIVSMFIGRLGPMTIALIIGGKESVTAIRYPEEEVVVG